MGGVTLYDVRGMGVTQFVGDGHIATHMGLDFGELSAVYYSEA